MKHLSILIFAWIACVSLGSAREPVRLAISGDPAFANDADLITVELSKSKEIILLERQHILKIADEHSLHAGKAGDDIKLGQLLGADGLLILSNTEVNGRKLLSARLVAVHLGVVIDEWISPPYEAAEGRAMPVFFSSRIVPLLPKLRLDKKDIVPVSVAGLFAAVDSPELRSIEKELTWLLIHRLTREPSLLVLERRQMQDLVLEKNLANAEKSPFLGGAVIVEGKLEEHDGKLDLALGLRHSGEKKATPVNIQGQKHELKAFADRITASILGNLKLKPAQQNWNLEEEAAMYADQAEWALQHRMIDLCIASAESAWALGRRDVDLARLRVIAYSLIATPYWPDIIGDSLYRGGLNVGFRTSEFPGKDPVRDLAAAIRALEISSECLSQELPPSRITGRKFRPVAAQALTHASLIIKKHYLSGKYQEHAEQLNHLRKLAIDVATALSKTPELYPHYYSMRYRKDSLTLQAIATYAPYWHDNNEDVIAWYHLLFKSVPLGEEHDNALMDTYSLENDYRPLPRVVPWVVAWDPAENRKRQLDMIMRLKRLTESADFDDQLVGWASLQWLVTQAAKSNPTENDINWPRDYAAALAGGPTKESPHQIVTKGILKFHWDSREKLAVRYPAIACGLLRDAVSKADRDYRMRYIRYIFDSEHYNHWIWIGSLLENLEMTEEERMELYRSCAAAREKAKERENSEYKERFINGLAEVEKMLVKDHPQLKPESAPKPNPNRQPNSTPTQPPSSPPIIVTRYWYPSASANADTPKVRGGYGFNTNDRSRISVSYMDGKIWFVQNNYLGSVALDSFETKYRDIPLNNISTLHEAPTVTKDAFYLLDEKGNMKFDFHKGEWSTLDLPKYPSSGKVLGDFIYIRYEFGSEYRGIDLNLKSSVGSGIIRLDPTNNSTTFLASSRRRPAETILDACEPYVPQALFSGAGGTVSAALEFPSSGERKIFRTTATGDWEKVMDLPNTETGQVHFQYVNDGVLAYMTPRGSPDTFYQCIFFDAAGSSAEVLLSRSKPSDPPDAILPGAPRWDMPADYSGGATDYFNGHLYQVRLLDHVYSNHKKNAEIPTPDVVLSVYTPGSRLPVAIPLRFQIPEADKTQIIASKPSRICVNDDVITSGPMADDLAIKNVERVSGMKVVPEGIIFFGGGKIGFWLLTKKELEERILQSRK